MISGVVSIRPFFFSLSFRLIAGAGGSVGNQSEELLRCPLEVRGVVEEVAYAGWCSETTDGDTIALARFPAAGRRSCRSARRESEGGIESKPFGKLFLHGKRTGRSLRLYIIYEVAACTRTTTLRLFPLSERVRDKMLWGHNRSSSTF
jgi:hypothetical protein